MEENKSYKIFSYGRLQLEPVQLSLFGRQIPGTPDRLRCYRLSTRQINSIVAPRDIIEHPIAIYTDNERDSIDGMVFDISKAELTQADEFKRSDFKRIEAQLDSGITAWVYVKK